MPNPLGLAPPLSQGRKLVTQRIIDLITTVFVDQSLALPGSDKVQNEIFYKTLLGSTNSTPQLSR